MTLKIGEVTSTFIEDGVTILNVLTDRPGNEPREVPLLKPLSGAVYVPESGDTVALDKLSNGEFIATGVLNRNQTPNPEHGQQEFSMVLDEDTEFSFVKDENGNYDVVVSSSGTITIDSDQVRLGGDTNTKVVARKGDTVEVQSDLEGTLNGQITGSSSIVETQ